MTTLTLPEALLRHAIGLDHLHRFAETASGTNYPPHNIAQIGPDQYELTLAVAGFSRDEISITLQNRVLSVEGVKPKRPSEPDAVYVHRGISFRDWSRQFTLAPHIEVVAVQLENGLLTIGMERQVPEAAKPKRIAIG